MEVWRDCVGYEGVYAVSNFGRVKRLSRAKGAVVGKCLSAKVTTTGYRMVCLCVGQKRKMMSVHRLVCRAFWGEPPPGKNVVCHNDGNGANNRLNNLRWDSQSGNMRDTVRHGTDNRGQKHYKTSLTVDDVVAILADTRKHAIIAAQYGISRSSVGLIKGGQRWACVRDMDTSSDVR